MLSLFLSFQGNMNWSDMDFFISMCICLIEMTKYKDNIHLKFDNSIVRSSFHLKYLNIYNTLPTYLDTLLDVYI